MKTLSQEQMQNIGGGASPYPYCQTLVRFFGCCIDYLAWAMSAPEQDVIFYDPCSCWDIQLFQE